MGVASLELSPFACSGIQSQYTVALRCEPYLSLAVLVDVHNGGFRFSHPPEIVSLAAVHVDAFGSCQPYIRLAVAEYGIAAVAIERVVVVLIKFIPSALAGIYVHDIYSCRICANPQLVAVDA